MITCFKRILIIFLLLVAVSAWSAEGEPVDTSDPTKIYSYLGGGLKYNEYTNGEYMLEARLTGNLGLGASDMLLFEVGYGRLQGHDVIEDSSDWTDARLRWYHLFEMDHDAIGYRGMGTQLDVQLAGELPGTDGQSQIIMGVMPTWNLSPSMGLFLSLNVANAWDKDFSHYNGAGVGFDAQFIYSNEDWWPGAQLRLIPAYTYFMTGELDGEGSGYVELNVGGQVTPTLAWDVTAHKNVDKDLRSFKRDDFSELENDWNVFLNVTHYF
jgi:hypothetical protein